MDQDQLFVRTDRERRFSALAERLAAPFAERAALHDRENSFPHENFAELRASGYTRLTVPAQYGGEGASLTETLLAQERLGRGDGSTALAVGWHLSLVGKVTETGAWPRPVYERVMHEVVREGALINSAGSEVETGSPSRGGRPMTTARQTADGGWSITGRKAFTTLSPALTYALVSAGIDGRSIGGWFLVPMNAPGVQIVETWDAVGMRATGSHELALDGVNLPADALVEEFGPGATCQVSVGGGAGWGLHIPAAYVGVAWAAREYALRYARERRVTTLGGPIAEVPHIQAQLGEIELRLYTARAALYQAARMWDEAPEHRDEIKPLLGAAKVTATNAAVEIVDRAMRVLGIASLSRKLPMERYYRDVRGGLHNPPMEDAAIALLAKGALKSGD